jgi:hypothetical protein
MIQHQTFSMPPHPGPDRELNSIELALEQDRSRERAWKTWGPYLADRQWGTVREDYSNDGRAWDYFSHDEAPCRAYRWGEDGLFGWADNECRLCFAFAFWNGHDPILKERLFGTRGPNGAMETYAHLAASPIFSYCSALYRYPQVPFPYEALSHAGSSFGLEETGVFAGGRFFDIRIEYAKGEPDDTLIRLTVTNHASDAAPLHILPIVWFRNTWSWGRKGAGYCERPVIRLENPDTFLCEHETLGRFHFFASNLYSSRTLFTENETNLKKLFNEPNESPYTKDAFHEAVVRGRTDVCNPNRIGTKAARHYQLRILPGLSFTLHFRLYAESRRATASLGYDFEELFGFRKYECEDYLGDKPAAALPEADIRLARTSYAALLWSHQYYHYAVNEWLDGDPAMPRPPGVRERMVNAGWHHLHDCCLALANDGWARPWRDPVTVAASALAYASVDSAAAWDRLGEALREGLALPDGRLPGVELDLASNHRSFLSWSAVRLHRHSPRPDVARQWVATLRRDFLARRSLPEASQEDRAWEAFEAAQLMQLASDADPDDSAAIEALRYFSEAAARLEPSASWDDAAGRHGEAEGQAAAVSLATVLAASLLTTREGALREHLLGQWHSPSGLPISLQTQIDHLGNEQWFVSVADQGRLSRDLALMFQEGRCLSAFGFHLPGQPLNPLDHYLLIDALLGYDRFYGDRFQVEFPGGSGRWVRLRDAGGELASRFLRAFLPGPDGTRPVAGPGCPKGADFIPFPDLIDPATGAGMGAKHSVVTAAIVELCLQVTAFVRALPASA